MVTGLAVCSRTSVDWTSVLKSRRKTRLNARGASSRSVKAALTREKRVSTMLKRVASHYATIWGNAYSLSAVPPLSFFREDFPWR